MPDLSVYLTIKQISQHFKQSSDSTHALIVGALTNTDLPVYYASIFHLLQLAIYNTDSLTDPVPADLITKTHELLVSIRIPARKQASDAEVQAVQTLTKAGFGIMGSCGSKEVLEDLMTSKAAFNLLWNEIAKSGKDKYQYGLDLLASHDRLVAADSKMLKAAWQPPLKNIEVIEGGISGDTTAPSGGATTRRPPANLSLSLEEEIAAIDPNLTPEQHAAEVRRLKHNKTSRESHRRARAASRANSVEE
jgi:hypothetical protein